MTTSDWITAAVGLGGAVIGGGMAMWATWWTLREDRKRGEAAERRQIRGMLQALHTEVSVLWEQYSRSMGDGIKGLENLPKGMPFDSFLLASQGYVEVYKSNTRLIGDVKSDELRTLIVSTYMAIMGLIDTFSTNNHFIEQLAGLKREFDATNSTTKQRSYLQLLEVCANYGQSMRRSHLNVKSKIEGLIPKLTAEIAKLSD